MDEILRKCKENKRSIDISHKKLAYYLIKSRKGCSKDNIIKSIRQYYISSTSMRLNRESIEDIGEGWHCDQTLPLNCNFGNSNTIINFHICSLDVVSCLKY